MSMYYANQGDVLGSGYVSRILEHKEKLKDISISEVRNRFGAYPASVVKDLQESKNLPATLSRYSTNIDLLSIVAGQIK